MVNHHEKTSFGGIFFPATLSKSKKMISKFRNLLFQKNMCPFSGEPCEIYIFFWGGWGAVYTKKTLQRFCSSLVLDQTPMNLKDFFFQATCCLFLSV